MVQSFPEYRKSPSLPFSLLTTDFLRDSQQLSHRLINRRHYLSQCFSRALLQPSHLPCPLGCLPRPRLCHCCCHLSPHPPSQHSITGTAVCLTSLPAVSKQATPACRWPGVKPLLLPDRRAKGQYSCAHPAKQGRTVHSRRSLFTRTPTSQTSQRQVVPVTGHSPPGSASNFRESVSSTSSGRPSDFYSPRLPTGYTDRSSVSSISSLSTTSSLSSATAAESIPGHTNHSVAAESIPGHTSHSAATESIPGHTNHSVAAESIPGHTNHFASPGSHPSNGMDSSSPQGKTLTPSNLENCFPYVTMVSSKLSLVSISFKGIKLHQHLKFPQLMMQLENKKPTGTALKKKKDKGETNHF